MYTVINNQEICSDGFTGAVDRTGRKEWGWLLRQTCQGFELRWFGSGARKLQIQQAFAAHPPKRTIRPTVLHAVAKSSQAGVP